MGNSYQVITNSVFVWSSIGDASDIDKHNQAVAKAKREYDKAKNDYDTATIELDQYRSELNDLVQQKDTLTEEINVLSAKNRANRATMIAKETAKIRALDAVNNQKAAINRLKDAVRAQKTVFNNALRAQTTAQSNYDIKRTALETQREYTRQLEQEMHDAEYAYVLAKSDYEAAESPIPADIITTYRVTKAKYDLVVNKYTENEAKISTMEQELLTVYLPVLNEANAKLDTEQTKLNNLESDLEVAQDNLQILEEDYNHKKLEYQSAQNAYTQSTAELTNASNQLSSLLVVIASKRNAYSRFVSSLSSLKRTLESKERAYKSEMRKSVKTYKAVLYKGCIVELNNPNSDNWCTINRVIRDRSAGSPRGGYVQLIGSDFSLVADKAYTETYVIDYEASAKANEEKYRVAGDKLEQEIQYAELSTEETVNYYLDSTTYKNMVNEGEYRNNINAGLTMSDIRPILGLPSQLLPTTDIRDADNSSDNYARFGRVYTQQILKDIPLLLLQPGVPKFLSGSSTEERRNILSEIVGHITGSLRDVLEDNSTYGKFYSLEPDFAQYYKYVNTMLRAASVMLGIQDEVVNGKKLGDTHWLYTDEGEGTGINYKRFIGPYTGCVALYADCGTDVSDSFGNTTSQSNLASSINSISDQARELSFFLGISGSEAENFVGDDIGSVIQGNMQNISESVDKIINRSGTFSSLLSKAQTVLSGGRLIFPEIWTDSSFGRSYSCKMKLVAPYGAKLCVFLKILVPIYHLLAFVLPKSTNESNQAYTSPMLIRGWYKGKFNIDMGIMTDLSWTRGAEGEWTVDGIPTVADVSFNIKDLYDGMGMSGMGLFKDKKAGTDTIFSNIAELDYIANSCGININANEVSRLALSYVILIKGQIIDSLTADIFTNICQYFNNRINDIFGVF